MVVLLVAGPVVDQVVTVAGASSNQTNNGSRVIGLGSLVSTRQWPGPDLKSNQKSVPYLYKKAGSVANSMVATLVRSVVGLEVNPKRSWFRLLKP
jgi:hypothetical protein